jgi:hypothetical protein
MRGSRRPYPVDQRIEVVPFPAVPFEERTQTFQSLMLGAVRHAMEHSLANALSINHCEPTWKDEPWITEKIQDKSRWLLRGRGYKSKQQDSRRRREAVFEGQRPEVPVEGDQKTLLRTCACQDLLIGHARHRLRCGKNVVACRAQGRNARQRDVLVGQ